MGIKAADYSPLPVKLYECDLSSTPLYHIVIKKVLNWSPLIRHHFEDLSLAPQFG